VSQKDFRYTIKRCLKESKETRFFFAWLPPRTRAGNRSRDLYREASELVHIFASCAQMNLFHSGLTNAMSPWLQPCGTFAAKLMFGVWCWCFVFGRLDVGIGAL